MPADAQEHEERIATLERDIADLKQSVRALERMQVPSDSGLNGWHARSQPHSIIPQEQLDCILHLTKDLFGDDVSVEVETDPEWPDEPFVVFLVTASGDIQDLLEKQHQWQREVVRLAAARAELIRISIAPRHD